MDFHFHLSFKGHSRPARSFRHKIDCSAETVRVTAKVTIEHYNYKSYVFNFCRMAPSSMTLDHVTRQGKHVSMSNLETTCFYTP